jgi:hypothetical protein
MKKTTTSVRRATLRLVKAATAMGMVVGYHKTFGHIHVAYQEIDWSKGYPVSRAEESIALYPDGRVMFYRPDDPHPKMDRLLRRRKVFQVFKMPRFTDICKDVRKLNTLYA